MNRWKPSEELRIKLKEIIGDFIDTNVKNKNIDYAEIDLSDVATPSQIWDVLEKDFGYDNDGVETNGWQGDFSILLYKDPEEKSLLLSGTGMIFEVKLITDIDLY